MQQSAATILRGGTVLTMDPARPTASWVAIARERILGVGDGDAGDWIGPDTQIIELAGRTAIPGLVDTHVHVASNARDDRDVDCRDFFVPTDSVEAILRRLADAASRAQGTDWIVGTGSPMQERRLREHRRPTPAELDDAVPDRPAYLTFGAHILVANRHALAAVGIDGGTPDPTGGVIERDGQGRATGVLREAAQELIKRRRPGPTPDLVQRLERELQWCAARGVTTIHDIVKSGREIRAYLQLEREGRLPVRVQLLPRVVQAEFEPWIILELGLLTGFGSTMVSLGGIKVSVDGGSSAGQAAFYPSESDAPDWRPILRMQPDELDELLARYHDGGVRTSVHAVGDRALDVTLASFAKALSRNGSRDHRHRIEHMGNFLATPARLAEAKRLGVVPVPNPSNMLFMGAAASDSVGEQRMTDAFALRSILDAGMPLAFGSDGGSYWPVDPLRDIAAAVSRRTMDGTVVAPHQAITVDEGLAAQTRTAAWLGFAEDRLGTIAEGKLADIAVLAGDPRSVSPDELGTMPVDLTIMNGTIVHWRAGGDSVP